MSKFFEITIDIGYSRKDLFFDLDEVAVIQGITDERGRFYFMVILRNGFQVVSDSRDKDTYEKILSAKKASQEYEIINANS